MLSRSSPPLPPTQQHACTEEWICVSVCVCISLKISFKFAKSFISTTHKQNICPDCTRHEIDRSKWKLKAHRTPFNCSHLIHVQLFQFTLLFLCKSILLKAKFKCLVSNAPYFREYLFNKNNETSSSRIKTMQ